MKCVQGSDEETFAQIEIVLFYIRLSHVVSRTIQQLLPVHSMKQKWYCLHLSVEACMYCSSTSLPCISARVQTYWV